MKTEFSFKVQKRDAMGKGPNRRLRGKGIVPGIYYSSEANIPVQAPEVPLMKAYSNVGSAQVFNLEIEDGDNTITAPAMFKEIIFHQTKNQILHVDFYGVDLSKKIKLLIPLEFTGKPKGVEEGGDTVIFRDHLEVLCLPTEIPEHIEVDITAIEIGSNLQVEDIASASGVEIIYEDNFAVVGVVAKEESEEEEASEDEE